MTQINNKRRILQITITQTNQFKCSLLNQEENVKEEIIKLRPEEDFYIPSILFNQNKIEICPKQTEINILEDLINQPDEYKLYEIKYQQKQYQLTFEVIFGLIIDHFKQTIEKDYIIEETIVDIPSRDYEAIRRIEICLNSINLNNVEVNPLKFDYEEQTDNFREIKEKKLVYEKNERMYNRAK